MTMSRNYIPTEFFEFEEPKKKAKPEKVNFTREDLVELFINQNLNSHQIAAKFGYSNSYITKKLKEVGLKKTKEDVEILDVTKAELLDMFITEKMSTFEIADMYDVPRESVVMALANTQKLRQD